MQAGRFWRLILGAGIIAAAAVHYPGRSRQAVAMAAPNIGTAA